MALPFIVGPHQCSLTHGPEGYPQVEVTFRLRLPIAEFIDAILLSLAEQRPLFQQTSQTATSVAPTPVITGSPAGRVRSMNKGMEAGGGTSSTTQACDAGPHPKDAKRQAPSAPIRYTKRTPDVDPTRAKLLATLSRAVAVPEATAPKPNADWTHPTSPSNEETRHGATTKPQATPFSRQAASSTESTQPRPPRESTQRSQGDDHTMGFRPPLDRLRTRRNVLRSKLTARVFCLLLIMLAWPRGGGIPYGDFHETQMLQCFWLIANSCLQLDRSPLSRF